MKRVALLLAVITLLLQPGYWFVPGVIQARSLAANSVQPISEDMPGYANPPQPIPYNKPGYPSKMGIDTRTQLADTYQPWNESTNRLSAAEVSEALTYNADYDPMINNYQLVDWDNLVVAAPAWNTETQKIRAWKFASETATGLSSTLDLPTSASGPTDPQLGDINNDGIDEYVDITGGVMSVGNLSQKRFIQGEPAVVSARNGVTWLFARGYDDQLWVLRDTNIWTPLGGTLASSPTAVYVADDQVAVLALDSQNHVRSCQVNATTATCKNAWDDLLGLPASQGQFIGEPVMTAESGIVQDVFVRGSGNRLWHRANRNGWQNWECLSDKPELNLNNVLSSPRAVSSNGRIDLVTGWISDSVLHIWRTSDQASWQWESIYAGKQFQHAVSIVSPAPGMLDLFAVGASSDPAIKYPALQKNALRNGSWSGWTEFSTSELTAPESAPVTTLVRGGGSKVVLYYTAHDQSIYSSTRDTPEGNWASFSKLDQLLGMWNTYPNMPSGQFQLGHFLPDGRMQGILYSNTTAEPQQLELKLYEFRGGFEPVQVGVQSATIILLHGTNIVGLQAKAGDYDGDGVEELAVLASGINFTDLYVMKLDSSGSFLIPPSSTPLEYFAPQGILLSGHFFDDEIADEELGVGAAGYINLQKGKIKLFNVAADLTITEFSSKEDLDKEGVANYASGDVIPETGDEPRRDEIIYTVMKYYGDPSSQCIFGGDDLYQLYIYVYRVGEDQGHTIKQAASINWQSFLVSCRAPYFDIRVSPVAGDLKRNGKNIIGLLISRGAGWDFPAERWLDVLEVVDSPDGYSLSHQGIQIDSNHGRFDNTGKLVAGNLTGEGLRLGKPTFRLVKNLGFPVAWINAPPKVWDETYWNSDTNQADPHLVTAYSNATLALSDSEEQSITLDFKTGAKFSWGSNWSIGPKATRITKSVNASVGVDFSKVSGSTQTVRRIFTIKTDNDILLLSMVNYGLYEYPILDNTVIGTIGDLANMLVTTPNVLKATEPMKQIETSRCGWVYNPHHDIMNMLSYPTSVEDMPDYDPAQGAFYSQTSVSAGNIGSEQDIQIVMSQANQLKLGMSIKLEVSLKSEVAYPIVSPVVGKGSTTLQGDFYGSIGGETDVKTGEELSIQSHFGGINPNLKNLNAPANRYQHDITPYFYWNRNKTLVLNYATSPDLNSDYWGGYGGWSKPDLAFIRPWSRLSCNDGNGISLGDFSPEITFSLPGVPPAPDVSTDSAMDLQKVKVAATVHNYSLNPVSRVPVEFYYGDPAAGGSQITCDTHQGDIDIAARGSQQVQCVFTAHGAGEQRIYVIADPGKVKDEHYEDNNKAFSLLYVHQPLNALGADPGLAFEKPGLQLTLEPTTGKKISLFVPYESMPDKATSIYQLNPNDQYPRSFTFLNEAVNTKTGAWETMSASFGLDLNGSRVITRPTAGVSIEYTHADLRPGRDVEGTLRLFYWDNVKRVWESQETTCGKVMRDPVNNVVHAPICKTGTYVLMSTPPDLPVYLPVLTK